MYFLCGIYRYIEFAADYAYGLYVVGVVVGYKYALHITQAQTALMQMVLNRANTHTGIYQHCVIISLKIVTVATTATAQ